MTLLVSLSLPASALRCDGEVIARGDHVIEVLEHCGEPVYRDEYVVQQAITLQHHPLLPYYTEIRPVSVQEWTYNFGRNRFMRQIRFEDGVIRKIRTLRKGFE